MRPSACRRGAAQKLARYVSLTPATEHDAEDEGDGKRLQRRFPRSRAQDVGELRGRIGGRLFALKHAIGLVGRAANADFLRRDRSSPYVYHGVLLKTASAAANDGYFSCSIVTATSAFAESLTLLPSTPAIRLLSMK